MVFAIMYCVLMFIQQRMMPMGSMDPAQQKMLKMMPLIFGVLCYFSKWIGIAFFHEHLADHLPTMVDSCSVR